MNTQLKPKTRFISVANLSDSSAITGDLRLDVTNFGFNLPRPELIEIL